jgi:hypothetical protein
LWLATVLLSLLFPSLSFAAKVTLAWDPNREPSLAGYKLYHGFSSGNYVGSQRLDKGTTTVTIDVQGGVKYFFARKAALDLNANYLFDLAEEAEGGYLQFWIGISFLV